MDTQNLDCLNPENRNPDSLNEGSQNLTSVIKMGFDITRFYYVSS